MSDQDSTATAHHFWDGRWQTDAGRADWLAAEPDVVACAERLRSEGAVTALDLGCGVGRHALLFAELGFATTGFDASPAGLAHLAAEAKARGLAVETREGLMTALPFADASFDYVLAFNVIHHGDGDVVRRSIAEIARVLKPGCTYQGTMLSKRNANFGKGTEIAPDTFVIDGVDDKDHPHFYCNAHELVALFAGFELRSLVDQVHRKPGSWHWHVIAERR